MRTSLIITALTIICGTAMASDPVTHIPFVQKSLKTGYGNSHIYSLQAASISSDIPMEKESGENFYRGRRQYIDEYNSSVEYGGMLRGLIEIFGLPQSTQFWTSDESVIDGKRTVVGFTADNRLGDPTFKDVTARSGVVCIGH